MVTSAHLVNTPNRSLTLTHTFTHVGSVYERETWISIALSFSKSHVVVRLHCIWKVFMYS